MQSPKKYLTRLILTCACGFLFAAGAAAQTTPTQPPQTPVPSATPPVTVTLPPNQPPNQPLTQPNVPAGQIPGTTPPTGVTAAPPIGIQSNAPAPTAAGQDVGTSGVAPAQLPANPPAIEPNFEAPARPLPSAERVGVDVSLQTPLSLNEVITLALENNNNIEASRIDVRLSEFDLTAARGVYDPRFFTESYYERSKIPTASSLGGANGSTTTSGFNANLGLNGFTPFAGGSYQSAFTSARQTTDNPFTSLNPQFPSALTFSYTQPLFRGRRTDDNRRRIEIAKKNLSLTDAQFRQQSIAAITQVINAYWDLTFALRNLQVQIDAVKQARTQVESNQRQVQEGLLAPIDIIAADTQVTNFEQNVYTAQEQVTRAESTLKTLILPKAEADLWARAIVPTTPVNVEAPRTSFEEALGAAMTTRPELAQLQTSKEINEINALYFRDRTKPQIDLIASFTGAGLAGTSITTGSNPLISSFAPIIQRVNDLSALNNLPPLPVADSGGNAIPNNLIGGYGQSLQNIVGFNYPTFRLGVRVDLPFGNRTAKANLGRSLAEGTRIEAQRDQIALQIKFEVQTSLQTLRSAEARLASAAASRSSGEQLYASEQRRFENGTSTIFLVLQRQQELVAARARELQAQTDLNKAIADFQRATGNTFQSHNVTVKDDETTRTRQLKIDNPAPADTDGAGYVPAQPRVSPVISRSAETNSLTAKP
ncbi:MAG: TolC family protein [Acidobacteriota bacterium]|nr:TolC family protein [Acidobacteriota bacterium]